MKLTLYNSPSSQLSFDLITTPPSPSRIELLLSSFQISFDTTSLSSLPSSFIVARRSNDQFQRGRTLVPLIVVLRGRAVSFFFLFPSSSHELILTLLRSPFSYSDRG